jgi:hypothetical protein
VVDAVTQTNTNARDGEFIHYPNRQLRHNKANFENYETQVKLDAVHDFYNDPANAGKVLNLPESGIPETVSNVRVVEDQTPIQPVAPKH